MKTTIGAIVAKERLLSGDEQLMIVTKEAPEFERAITKTTTDLMVFIIFNTISARWRQKYTDIVGF